MNNRHRRVERLRHKYSTSTERSIQKIIESFKRFGEEAKKRLRQLEKQRFKF